MSGIPSRTKDYTMRRYRDRAAWLLGRSSTIGASEVATVMGIAPRSWGTAYDLWQKKRATDVADDGNADTARGAAAEPHIRELLAIENPNLKVCDMTGRIFRSRRFPWLSCSLDAAIVHADGTFDVVEIKDVRYTPHWKAGAIPRHYLYQCAAQLLVTGARNALLLARIDYRFSAEGHGDELERLCAGTVREVAFRIKRAEVRGQFAGIVRETEEFWNCVKSGTPPPEHMRR